MIDYKAEPKKHKYTKCMPSKMNPGSKITWPQWIVEQLIQNRARFIQKYKSLAKGPGWSTPIQAEIVKLQQQAANVLSYFDNPETDKDVASAVLAYFKKFQPLKIGAYRKTRFNNQGRLCITQEEKQVVNGIDQELQRIVQARPAKQQEYKIEQKSGPKTFRTRA